MDANTNPIELCGTVAAVIYQNEENGYTVLKLDVDDGSQTMVVGCIPYAVPGESMIVTGSWMTHPAHGQQFKAEFAERTMPETADAIYAYLAGRAVRGIGPATASLLVSRFGADTLNVLEYEPEKLTAIKGISLSRAKAMSANFRRQAGMRRLIEFLASANIRPVIALRMYQYYGDEALQLVQDNPYILVSDAIGATFQEADALALGHGFDDQSAERVAAATLYELAYNAVRGHCFISYRNLLAATSQLSGVSDELVAQSVDTLVERGELVRERVAGCDGCYLARLHEAEAYTAERLLVMAQNEYRRMPDTDKIAAQIEAQLGLTFAEQQKETLRLACQHQVIAITGGPGTGKTTSIRAILALFDVLKLDTQLAAPRTEDLPQILGQLSFVAVTHAAQQIAFQVRRTTLQRRSGKDRTDDILQALQPVGTDKADLPNASFLQLCEHLAPAQGALRGLIEDPQHFAPLVFTHGKYHIKSFCFYAPLAVDLHVYAIDEDDWVISLQRAREPLRNIFSKVVQHPRNTRLAVVLAIDILEYLADLFLRKTFRIQRSGKAFAFILLMA